MIKEINFDLEYRDQGQKKTLPLKIDFVSNWCIREFNNIMQITYDVKNKWDQISDLNTEISGLKTEKLDGYKSEVNLRKEEIKVLQQGILAYADSDIFKRRISLIKQILEDNEYKQGFLFNYDFWDRQVDPGIMIDFLSKCIWKDIDDKKKIN